MVQFLEQIFRQFQSVFHRLSARQKMVVSLVSVITFGAVLWIMTWAGQREFVVLMSNLDPQDAQKIVEKLEADGIPYQLATEGTAILVEQGRETGMRLELAAEAAVDANAFELGDARSSAGCVVYSRPCFSHHSSEKDGDDSARHRRRAFSRKLQLV